MSQQDLPTRIRSYLSKCPGAVSGSGGHNRTFNVACTLVNGFALSEAEALGFLSEWNGSCSPPWNERELFHKIKGAASIPHEKPRGHLLIKGEKSLTGIEFKQSLKVLPRWPKLDSSLISMIQKSGHGTADLWEASSIRPFDDANPDAMLDVLFHGNPLLCIGKNSSIFATKEREQWRGQLSGQQFIVPSPMSALTGKTQDGKESAHCLDNTGSRRFIVIEFDSGTVDLQAAIVFHLRKFAPLTCAVHSGGKSIHGWFYCHGLPEEKVWKFFRYAVSIGADRATWTRSQFVRLPDGTRDNGKPQSVLFLNPEAIKDRP